jgi:hypothetical protein
MARRSVRIVDRKIGIRDSGADGGIRVAGRSGERGRSCNGRRGCAAGMASGSEGTAYDVRFSDSAWLGYRRRAGP